ncbi:unnamed protein product [Phytomonas sp. Hart1]|nr:unnamed protein product [Phytomonas sp. Hart1]|eukprot:CCW66833.1 unnamed protein product [Phytomonas sp. isolate Hart1]
MAETTFVEETPVIEDAARVVDEEPSSLEDAIRIVIQKSLEANGLVRGLTEVARALDRNVAHLCILAEDCEDGDYKKLITALAKRGSIDLINVGSRVKLAEWSGLVRKNSAGEITKTLKCSSVVIYDFGEKTRAMEYLLSHLH